MVRRIFAFSFWAIILIFQDSWRNFGSIMGKTKTGRRSLANVVLPYKLPSPVAKRVRQNMFEMELLHLDILNRIEVESAQRREQAETDEDLPLTQVQQQVTEESKKDITSSLKEEIQKMKL